MSLHDEDTLPPLHSPAAREERSRLRVRIVVWLLILVVAGAIVSMHGCAQLPYCPRAEARILRSADGGVFIGFTPEGMIQWQQALRMEALHECAFEKKGEV